MAKQDPVEIHSLILCFTDYVFNDETETSTIYEKLVKPMVTSSLEGYNGEVIPV